MKSKKLGLFLTLALVLTGALAFAQDAPKEEESPIKISGQAFTSFTTSIQAVPNSFKATSLGSYAFDISRLYLKWDHALGKNFAYHVIIDATQEFYGFTNSTFSLVTFSGSSQTQGGKVAFVPYVKEAWLEAKAGIDDVLNLNIGFGLIATPIIKNRNKMSDDRWLTVESSNGFKNIIGFSPFASTINGLWQLNALNRVVGPAATLASYTLTAATNRGDGDQSNDMGLGIDITVLKMITLTFAVTAGEGEKNITTDWRANNSGKAVYLDLFVEPIKGLYVTGFFRHEGVQFINPLDSVFASSVGYEQWFAGAGVGINMMGIRVGAEFESGQFITKRDGSYANTGWGSQSAQNFFVLNVWFNWNLQELAGFPLLVLGKVTYGMLNDPLAITGYTAAGNAKYDYAQIYDTVYFYAGLGWQFNKNVRIALLYEGYYFSDGEIYQSGISGVFGKATDTQLMADQKITNTGWGNMNGKIMLKTEAKF